MLKSTLLAAGVVMAAMAFAPVSASAASFGNQVDVAPGSNVEQAQYYYRRRYYRPRYRYYRRPYYRRFYFGY